MTDVSLSPRLTLGRVDMPLRPTQGLRRLYVHDLEMMADIGVYPEEKGVLQPIAVSVDLLVVSFTLGPAAFQVSILSLVGVAVAYYAARSLF